MSCFLVEPNSIYLNSSISRTAPRDIELRQEDYDEKFDFKTLFYDIFYSCDRVCLNGPPLFDLLDKIDLGSFKINNIQVPKENIHFRDIQRTQDSYILWDHHNLNEDQNVLSFKIAGEVYEQYFSNTFYNELENSNCLVTISKNNDIEWIYDWVNFYRDIHGINAVIIYDNNSDAYSVDEMKLRLEMINDVSVYIVRWNFPYGPQGGVWAGHKDIPWDSDYCQYGMLENVKYKFVRKSELVVNQDIDELLLADSDISINKYMSLNKALYVRYTGRWIEASSDSLSENKSFPDFVRFNPNIRPTTPKWAIRPNRFDLTKMQWKTHEVTSLPLYELPDLCHRHFTGISTKWKIDRTNRAKDKQGLIDSALVKTFQKVDVFKDKIEKLYPDITQKPYEIGIEFLSRKWFELFDNHSGLKKIWVWKDRTVVLDIVVNGVDIAFDTYLDEEDGTLSVKLVSRTEKINVLNFPSDKIDYKRNRVSVGVFDMSQWEAVQKLIIDLLGFLRFSIKNN